MDLVIVGAGIVGLATGYQFLRANPSLKAAILEKEDRPAKHQTGRNSGVIHSGVYYKPGSLKAKNCIAGRDELLVFCREFGISTQKIGKVIVATDRTQLSRLGEIEQRGRANGLEGLQRISREQLKEIEPHVEALEALWIPNVFIVSYSEVAQKLAEEFQRLGGEIHLGQKVEQIESVSEGVRVVSSSKEIKASKMVNCAGLFSDRIARKTLSGPQKHRILPFRGEYYELTKEKRDLVKGLIYPVPDPRFPFLGVHLTRMIDGKVEAGPNAVLAFAREGYRRSDFNLKDCLDFLSYPGFWKMGAKYWRAGFYEIARSLSKKIFLRDLQKLVPALAEKDLLPGGCGIRAQAVGKDGKLMDDFCIYEEKNKVHVLNAPSPAATASFAIGRQIAERVMRL